MVHNFYKLYQLLITDIIVYTIILPQKQLLDIVTGHVRSVEHVCGAHHH